MYTMEPDSTTNEIKSFNKGLSFPFEVQPGNLRHYEYIIEHEGEGEHQIQEELVKKLQSLGLLVPSVQCPSQTPRCLMSCKSARVVDRFQWVCEGCGIKLPIRHQSFFLRINCSLLKALQVILGWCEDADWEVVAQHFDVKTKVVNQIYDKLDSMAAEQQTRTQLGGPGAVVLAESYPECLNRLSPDTTDEPHTHNILMLADTKHIPTRYWLHVMKQDSKKTESSVFDNKSSQSEMQSVISHVVRPRSTLVSRGVVAGGEAGAGAAGGVVPLSVLLQRCDADMRHFLTTGIWSQALRLCAVARSGSAAVNQKYLHASLYKVRFRDGFYAQTLHVLANEYTNYEEIR